MSGDSIRVRPGTYFERIDSSGKEILITAELGPGATILDAQQQGSVVQFHNGESSGAVLQGFTIRGGRSGDGGGVSILGASPVIRGNRIVENTARSDRGGGLYCRDSNASIEDNTFERNIAGDRVSGFGAAIACESSEALIRGNRIRDNHAVGFSGFGAGHCLLRKSRPRDRGQPHHRQRCGRSWWPWRRPLLLEIHFAGLAWNAATGKVCSVSETR